MNILSANVPGLVARSVVAAAGGEWALAREGAKRRLVALLPRESRPLAELEGDRAERGGRTLVIGPASPRNASALRTFLPWLCPAPIGLRTSAGFGDRLGLATPGHVRALRAAAPDLAPIFAQQSIREMTRTGRTPVQVLDDATWGAFEEGWTGGVGSDADHLKAEGEIDACLEAGFTLFTFDPGAFVDAAAASSGREELARALVRVPWDRLETSLQALAARYVGQPFGIEGVDVSFDEDAVARAAIKYGAAVAHVAALYRHLCERAGSRPFEVEVSVDETEAPTSHAEHVFVATELRRLGVKWVSLAPRFVGRFEKGVDYIGDLEEFGRHLAGHAAIARALGPYKLSLHSGSDKFSLYGAVARETRGLVHLKTAGTSYLEALRVVAAVQPELFREIFWFACGRYEEDRASYHVSAAAARAAAALEARGEPRAALDDFHVRQVLHVTFGSVLTAADPRGRPRFAHRIAAVLDESPEAYATGLESHFARHLGPFAGCASA
ncbi:MAG TPA: tagaturonate epimerase family protein [Vicinamibacterales bacterium]|nr:tagaturonate epimerase family protein [Vicinamibacterales bacterium]